MKSVRTVWNVLAPMIVLGAVFAFVGYALFMYQPNEQASCQKTGIPQQVDIAIHTIRQWFGKEGQLYLTCEGK